MDGGHDHTVVHVPWFSFGRSREAPEAVHDEGSSQRSQSKTFSDRRPSRFAEQQWRAKAKLIGKKRLWLEDVL